MGCLNCNIELNHTPGKRKKQFCSPDCRVRYWQKNKPKKEKDFERELEIMLSDVDYRKRLRQANHDLFTFGFAIVPDDPKEPLVSPMSKKGAELIAAYLSQNKPPTAPETEKEGKTTLKQEKGKEGAENGPKIEGVEKWFKETEDHLIAQVPLTNKKTPESKPKELSPFLKSRQALKNGQK